MKYILVSWLIRLLPDSRAFRLKNQLWNMAGFKVAADCRLFSSVRISRQVQLSIGSDTFIGHDTIILGGPSKVSIGRNCDISSRVNIITGTHEINVTGNRMAGKGFSEDITIGNGVWIGVGATILAGVEIGDMALIGAGSVVNRNIPPYTIVGGVPAKVLKYWDRNTQEWVNGMQVR
ncbi:MAG TPA: acyltransferase [Chitinophaga sp.]